MHKERVKTVFAFTISPEFEKVKHSTLPTADFCEKIKKVKKMFEIASLSLEMKMPMEYIIP